MIMLRNQPADPAPTASQSLVMMGVGITFTPARSGFALVNIAGVARTNTATVGLTAGGRFGTGAPPVNGAAVTGMPFAADQVLRAASAVTGGTGFCLCDIVGLTPGIPYWFDIAVATATSADTAQVQNISAVIFEF